MAALKSKELILGLLKGTPAPFNRSQYIPGHITGTGLILHPSQEAILLVFHRRLERWLLPGGHVEKEDATAEDTARREVFEETGAHFAESGILVGMDVHGIPPSSRQPYHLHHDLVFGFRALSDVVRPTEEVRDARWYSIDELTKGKPQVPLSVLECAKRALLLVPLL